MKYISSTYLCYATITSVFVVLVGIGCISVVAPECVNDASCSKGQSCNRGRCVASTQPERPTEKPPERPAEKPPEAPPEKTYPNCGVGKGGVVPKSEWVAQESNATSGSSAKSMAVDAMGNIYVSGHLNASGDLQFGSHAVKSTDRVAGYIAKLNPAGKWQWAKRYDALGGDIRLSTNKDHIYAVGGGCHVAKLDADGNELWSQKLTKSTRVPCAAIRFDAQGNIYGTGGTTGLAFKLNPQGKLIWQRNDKGFPEGETIDIDDKGSVYVAGTFYGKAQVGTKQLTSRGEVDVFISKLDASGKPIWAIQAGSPSYDAANQLRVSSDGSVYLVGSTTKNAVFGKIQTTTGRDAFITKITPDGRFAWVRHTGTAGVGGALGNGLAIDAHGCPLYTGQINGKANFGNTSLKVPGGSMVFLAKLDPNGNYIWAIGAGSNSGGMEIGQGEALSTQPDGSLLVAGIFVGNTSFGGKLATTKSQSAFVWRLSDPTHP